MSINEITKISTFDIKNKTEKRKKMNMKNRKKMSNGWKKLTISWFFLLLVTGAFCQNITAFSFGTAGNVGDKHTVLTSIISFQNIACISMTSGLPTLLPSNNGMFINYCEVKIPKSDLPLELSASPNPMSANANIRLTTPINIINDEQVLLRIYNSYGNVVNEFTTMLSSLNTGYQLQFTNPMNNGIYFLKATSPITIFKPITLIKQK